MDTQTKANFTKDVANKKITVVKELPADINKVWAAYADHNLLDQWWAPKPWEAATKEFNFTEGGRWLYAMVGPDGERQWSKMDFQTINAPNEFSGVDAFTDKDGITDKSMPSIQWHNRFEDHGDHTLLTVELQFDSEEDMKKILDTGFEQGFSMGLDNLAELLSA